MTKVNYFDALNILKKREFQCYIITGNEAFQKTQLIDYIRAHYRKQNFEILSEQIINQQYDFLYQQHNSMSLFAAERLLQMTFNKAPNKNLQQTLVEMVANPSEENRYLLIFEGLSATQQKSQWFQKLSAKALHMQLWPLDIQGSVRVIQQELGRQKKITLSEDAIMLIAKKTEGNLLAAKQILSLLQLQQKKHFDCTHIVDFLEDYMNFDVFDLMQSVVTQQASRSVTILQNLFSENIEPAIILWAILKELRLWILLSTQDHTAQQTTFQKYNIWSSKQAAYLKLVSRFTQKQYQAFMEKCFTIDLIIKGIHQGDIKQQLIELIRSLHPQSSSRAFA